MKNLFHYILAFFSSTLCIIQLSPLPCVFPFFPVFWNSSPPMQLQSFTAPLTIPLQGHFRMDMGNWELNFSLQWSKIKYLYILLSPLQWTQALSWRTISSRPLCRKIAIPNVGGETPSSSIFWTNLPLVVCCLHFLL